MITVTNRTGRRIPKSLILRSTKRILRKLGKSDYELSIVFTKNRDIRVLNRTFRHIDRTTDVLSFPPLDNMPFKRILGDIVISLERAKVQARQIGHSVRNEIGRLLVHGIVHLCGYDHHRPTEARRMERLENRLLPLFR